MVGELLRIYPKAERPTYTQSNRRIQFYNGAVAFTYNATEPDQLRGPQHDFLWHNELCKWRQPRETWAQAQFGLRSAGHPRPLLTTPPSPPDLKPALIA